MKKLIVNCDDGFYSEERDLGIVHGLESGSITDVSLLMNGYVANNLMNNVNCSVLFNYLKEFSIVPGIHLNLTEGTPLKDVKTFINDDGIMLGKFDFPKRLIEGSIDLDEVELEISAQFERFETLFHRKPSHVDGHQHFHVLPGIIDFICRHMVSKNVKWIRIPNEILNTSLLYRQNMSRKSFDFYHSVVNHASKAATIAKSHHLRFPGFIGICVCGQNMTCTSLRDALSQLDANPSSSGITAAESVVELMSHPGYRTTTEEGGCCTQLGPDEFSRSPDREHELQVLQSDEVKEMWREAAYQLISFQQITNSYKFTN